MTRSLATDIARILDGKTSQERIAIATKLDAQLGAENEADRIAGEIILRRLAEDLSEYVRVAVAHALCTSPRLPRDVALRLALDVESVSLPVLEYSTVLRDIDLIGLVTALPNICRAAIARRASVGPDLARSLVSLGNDTVVEALIGNAGAQLDDEAFEIAIRRISDQTDVTLILSRDDIHAGIVLAIIDNAATQFSARLSADTVLGADGSVAVVAQARHQVILMLGAPLRGGALERYAEALRESGDLQDALMLAAARAGLWPFVIAGMAALARVRLAAARILAADRGEMGFRRLYDHARLPANRYAEFRESFLHWARSNPEALCPVTASAARSEKVDAA